jgi:prolyl 4-hydroxylase
MSIMATAERLVRAGRRDEAIILIEQAADQGDCEALYAVANWRLFGIHGNRDLNVAHALLDLAVVKKHVESMRTKAILLANGGGVPTDAATAEKMLTAIRSTDPHAALQLDFLHDMPPLDNFSVAAAHSLSNNPNIRYYPGLLNTRECNYLTSMAQPQLRPSFVTDPATGAHMPHPVRSSTGMSFGPTQEDLVVRRINERIAWVSNTNVSCGEPLHILHYTPGQQYRPHTDAIPGDNNQRHWTVLIYLNDDYSNGETSFPKLGINYRGGPGDALIFRNVDANGRADLATLHAGLPVTSGVKWLATRWIRARPYHPWD